MEQQTFDKLKISAEGFHSLLDTQYHLIIGRKGKSVDITIEFKPIDFHHLMGLGKLKTCVLQRRTGNPFFRNPERNNHLSFHL